MVRYRAVVLVLLFAVFPMRASFPCDAAEPPQRLPSPWSESTSGQTIYGTRPHVFAMSPSEIPEVRIAGGATVVQFELVRVAALEVVEGLFVFAPLEPLAPGLYCVNDYQCIQITDGIAPGSPPTSATVRAREAGKAKSNNGCAGTCGRDSWPRGALVQLDDLDYEFLEHVANWLIELSDYRDFSRNRTALLVNGHPDPSFALEQSGYDMEDFDQICAHITPVMWDGSLGPMIDAGCAEFE